MIASSWEIAILAAVQGLTEFLPISSSGHLVLAQALLGVDEAGVALEIVLHLGTLLAVVLFYRRDLGELLVGSAQFVGGARSAEPTAAIRTVGLLILGTLPAAVGGILLGSRIENAFGDPRWVTGALIVTGCVLLATLRVPRKAKPIGWPASLLIGFFQLLALFPGISRSGSTIAGGLFLGIKAEEAARFSFLLSIPVILGAAVLKAPELASGIEGGKAGAYLLGLVVSFAFGYLSIGVLLRLIRKGRFGVFGIYCLVVGVTGWIWLTQKSGPMP